MATRTWFRPDNTADLSKSDLAIINRATRHLVSSHSLCPSHQWLSVIRQTYRPGMSAADVIEAVNSTRDGY